MKNSHSESYAAAGVDVTAGYEAVERIKPMVESTYIPGVMGTLGGFGGMFAPDLAGMKKPVLVSGTDGVGTKLKLAFLMDKHDTVGIDCVAMCVNDIVCGGAAPMFFLDYIACGKNHPARIADIVSGITSAQKLPLAKEITVRQTPFVAILSPTCKSSSTFFACTSNTTLRFPRLIPRMVPISSIIPVNMLISNLQFMILDFLAQHPLF